MAEYHSKVCCNCAHCIRRGPAYNVKRFCDLDDHYVNPVACFDHWCRHWTKEEANSNDRKAVFKADRPD